MKCVSASGHLKLYDFRFPPPSDRPVLEICDSLEIERKRKDFLLLHLIIVVKGVIYSCSALVLFSPLQPQLPTTACTLRGSSPPPNPQRCAIMAAMEELQIHSKVRSVILRNSWSHSNDHISLSMNSPTSYAGSTSAPATPSRGASNRIRNL